MNRDELDAWFAQADDVLTDWRGSADSMNTATERQRTAAAEQIEIIGRAVQVFAEHMKAWADSVAPAVRQVGALVREAGLLPDVPPNDPRARALWLRQHRNTGPALTVGLDGRRRGRTPSDR